MKNISIVWKFDVNINREWTLNTVNAAIERMSTSNHM